jgi:hypothetical protein
MQRPKTTTTSQTHGNTIAARLGASRAAERYLAVRAQTELLIKPLSAEDCQLQSMPDASPAKWHLAHLTWFFETFLLERLEPDFKPFDPAFRVLFNSYYKVWASSLQGRSVA